MTYIKTEEINPLLFCELLRLRVTCTARLTLILVLGPR